MLLLSFPLIMRKLLTPVRRLSNLPKVTQLVNDRAHTQFMAADSKVMVFKHSITLLPQASRQEISKNVFVIFKHILSFSILILVS